MQTIQHSEFTNSKGDKVDVLLMQDSFGGFHLIVKAKLLRTTKEVRIVAGEPVELEKRTFTKETSHTAIEDEYTALNEFHLERYMNKAPDFGWTEYRAWQIANAPLD